MYRITFILALCFGVTTFAHDRFILPSHTILSGDPTETVPSVTLTASISNDIFHPDKPLGDDGTGELNPFLKQLFDNMQYLVVHPDGRVETGMKWNAFGRMSIADLTLKTEGTYRIIQRQGETFLTMFTNAEGHKDRRFGASPNLPEGATHIKKVTFEMNVVCFISLNSPNKKALMPIGKGLELGGPSHPNDLFVGENNSFQLTLDGKTLSEPASVVLIPGGTRHRNDRNRLELQTQPDGRFNVTLKKSGFYLLHAEVSREPEKPSKFSSQSYSLFATLEVFPE